MAKSTTLARLSLVALLIVCFLLASLHVLKADYDIRSFMISHYSVGRWGWIMVSAFVLWGGGLFLLTWSLLLSEHSSWDRRMGAALLFIASAGLVVSGMFNTSLPGMPDTRESDIHDLSFLINVFCFLVAIPLVSVGLRGERWRSFRPKAIGLAAFVVLSFAVFFPTRHKGMPYGITNRIFVSALLAWMIALALHLKSPPLESTESA